MKLISKLSTGLLVSALSSYSMAALIECGLPGNDGRIAELGSATECKTGTDTNPQVSTINDLYGGSWSNEGELTSSATNNYLTVSLTQGPSYGDWDDNSNIDGSWTIDNSFWSIFSDAVISMHVGHGNGDPDFFTWKIEAGETSGIFSYNDNDGKGGGLSNIKLWGTGTGTSTEVPEPGSVALLALGLLGLGLARRATKA